MREQGVLFDTWTEKHRRFVEANTHDQQQFQLGNTKKESLDLHERATFLRELGPDGNDYWPGVECAALNCAKMAVEAWFFCSTECRQKWRDSQ